MGFYPSEGDVDSNGAEEVNLRTAAGAELLGQQASAASLPVVISSDQSTLPISAASLPLPTGAATAALQTTGNTSLSSIDTKTATLVTGRTPVSLFNSSSNNQLVVNADGSINVSSAISTPPTSTTVTQTAFGTVSTISGTDTNYVITNTKILTIQRFTSAAEDEVGGTVIELFYDPNGDLSVLTRLDMMVVNGATYQTDLNLNFTGNGTRRIVMRRRGYTAAGREVFGRWEGYES